MHSQKGTHRRVFLLCHSSFSTKHWRLWVSPQVVCFALLTPSRSNRRYDHESPILADALGSGLANWRSGRDPGCHPQYGFARARHRCMEPTGSSSDCHSGLFLEHIHSAPLVDIWWCRMGCTYRRKRGSSAWLSHGPGRWPHPLPLKPGLWESCSEGAGHPCPEYGSWLPRWPLGQPRTVEVSVKVFLYSGECVFFLRLLFGRGP